MHSCVDVYLVCKMWSNIVLLVLSAYQVNGWTDNRQRRFKDDFMFGVSTSAFQIEGAWNEDGKGESIWDHYFQNHPDIKDRTLYEVAADSYHLYKRDVEMLRELGVGFYRFTLSWTRILPNGEDEDVNEKGLEYYDNLIDELLKYNIQPMITLYDMDLPQKLQDLGGWTNELSVKWFEDYARIVFKRYASKVRYWITINDPSFCFGYHGVDSALIVGDKGVDDYVCVKNTLLAHAKAYRLYEREYRNKYKGSVGLSIGIQWADPFNNQTENVEATDLYRDFAIGLYMNPIWSKDGDFPRTVRDAVARQSRLQGLESSRLPSLSAQELIMLKGSADFLGMNHYTTVLVKKSQKEYPKPSLEDDIGAEFTRRKEWKKSNSKWLRSAAYGIYKASIYINQKYDYPQIFITENGWSTKAGLQDSGRAQTMRGYLTALLLALEDGTEVRGFSVFSLMDHVGVNGGIRERFGLYEVDFDSEEKTRTARLSALVYKRIIKEKFVELKWMPENLEIGIDGKDIKIKDEL